MYVHLSHAAASLTSPAVTLQYKPTGFEVLSGPPRDPAALSQKWPAHSQNHGGNLRRGRRAPIAVARSTKARLAVFFNTRSSTTVAKLPASSTPGVILPVKGHPASVLGLI